MMQERSFSISFSRDMVAGRAQLFPAKQIKLILVGVIFVLIVIYLPLYQSVILKINGEQAVPEDNVIQVRPTVTAAEQCIENDAVSIKSNLDNMFGLCFEKDQDREDQTDPGYFEGHYKPADRGKSE